MGLPSFLPGGLSAALPRSCLTAVFAQSVGDAGYSVVKVQVGGKVPLYIRTFMPPKVRASVKGF